MFVCEPGGTGSPRNSKMDFIEKWPGPAGIPVSGLYKPTNSRNGIGHVAVLPVAVHPDPGGGGPEAMMPAIVGPVRVTVPAGMKKSLGGNPGGRGNGAGTMGASMSQAVPEICSWKRAPPVTPFERKYSVRVHSAELPLSPPSVLPAKAHQPQKPTLPTPGMLKLPENATCQFAVP